MFIFAVLTMPALTPFQSWAVILCGLGVIALVTHTLATRADRRTTPTQQPQTTQSAPDDLELPAFLTQDTTIPIRLIRYTVDSEQVYDWNQHGI